MKNYYDLPEGFSISGSSVEDLQKKGRNVKVKQDRKNNAKNFTYKDAKREFKRSINILIMLGHKDIRDYYYEDYTYALEDVENFTKLQSYSIASGISLCFSDSKKGLDDLVDSKRGSRK